MNQSVFIKRCYIFYTEQDIFLEIFLYLEGLFSNVQTHNYQMSFTLF